jgi:hypothetical protein
VVPEPSYPALCSKVVGSYGEPAGVLYALQTASSFNTNALDTTRIQSAITNCVPPVGQPAVAVELALNPGSTSCGSAACNAFLSGTLTLSRGVTLLIDPDVTLYAAQNTGGTVIEVQANSGSSETAYTGGSMGYWGIMGYGTIDGQGSLWGFSGSASKMISLSSANYFTLYQTTLQNPGKEHLIGSGGNLLVYDAKISTPANTSNTDGVDPSGTGSVTTNNITIVNSFFSQGDDHIAFNLSGGHVSGVTIAYNHLYAGHGISIGSYTTQGMENTLVTQNAIDNNGGFGSESKNSLRIKSDSSRGGEVKDILYDSICIQNGGHVLVFDPYYSSSTGTDYPNFHDITLQNINVLNKDPSGGPSTLEGYNTGGVLNPLYNVTLNNAVFNYTQPQFMSEFYANSNAGSEYGINYASFNLGPEQVSFNSTVWDPMNGVDGITVTDNTNSQTPGTPYNCTGAYTYLAGELFAAGSTGAPLASPLQVSAGSQVTLRAIVQPIVKSEYNPNDNPNYFVAPTTNGTLTFYDNDVAIGTAAVNGSRITNYVVSSVSAGTHVYTAQYSGDTNYVYVAGTSACSNTASIVCGAAPAFPSVTVTNGTPTTTTVGASPTSLTYGSSVQYTATVAPQSGSGTPTGTVVFTDGTVSSPAAQLSAGIATWTNPLPIAGSHTVTATYSGDSTYAGSAVTDSSLITVAPATVTATVTAASKPYDTTTTEPLANISCNPNVLAADQSNVSCAGTAAAFASANAGGGITVTVTGISLSGTAASNYTLSSTSATTTASIMPVAPTVTVTCPAATYSGSPQGCTAKAMGVGTDGDISAQGSFTWSPAQSETSAGTYPITATFVITSTNYTSGAQGSGSLAIAKATPTVTVSCPASPTYNGSSYSCSATATGVGTDGNITSQGSFTWSPAQSETSAGSYAITATFTSTNPNYNNSGSGSASLSIAKATVTASVTAANKPYDSTKTATVTACTLSGVLGSDNVTCSGTGTFASANAGNGITVTATVTLGGTAAGNYALASNSVTTQANITPVAPTVTVTCPAATYSGSPQGCTAKAMGVGTDGDISAQGTFTWSPAQSETSAGTYPITVTFAITSNNYTGGAQGSGSLVIAKATPTVTVTCPASLTYNGSSYSCSATATGVGTEGNISAQGSFTWSPAQSETSAGTYPITATFAITSNNYTSGAHGSGSLTIAPAAATVTVICPAVTYDGNAHGCTAAAATAAGAALSGSFTWSPAQSESAAGSYAISVTFASSDGNYSGSGSATLNIAAAVPAISSLSPAEQTANAAAFTLTVNGTGFAPGAVVNWNGSARTTTFVSATQLTAAISSSDLGTVGTAKITVTSPAAGGGASSASFTFAIDTAAGTSGAATVSATTQTVTVAPGGSAASLPVSFAGAGTSAQITANCVNLPAGVTCGAYSGGNVPITASASAVPGSYEITVIFTIAQPQTASLAHSQMVVAAAGRNAPHNFQGEPGEAPEQANRGARGILWSGLLGLPMGLLWIGGGRRKALRRVLLALVGLILLAAMFGCGGSSSSPAASTTITSQSSLAVTLTVQ